MRAIPGSQSVGPTVPLLTGLRSWLTAARTRYYKWRYRDLAVFGAGTRVNGRLRVRGPGRIVIGDGCVLGAGPGESVIHAGGPGTVRIGDGCHLNGLEISAADNVTIGAGAHVRDRLRIVTTGRVSLGEGCDATTLEILKTGDVTIGPGLRVRDRLHLEGAGNVTIGDGCQLNEVYISATGDVAIGAQVWVRSQLQVGGRGRVGVGDRCVFETAPAGTVLHAAGPAVTISIGEGCGINGLDVYADDDVTIGDRCMIGTCTVMTTDFHSTRRDRWSEDAPVKCGPVTVGSNVWIADRTIITKNVSIGDNSVVSIGTVVRVDVPPDVIVSSHQQRIVKELSSDQNR